MMRYLFTIAAAALAASSVFVALSKSGHTDPMHEIGVALTAAVLAVAWRTE